MATVRYVAAKVPRTLNKNKYQRRVDIKQIILMMCDENSSLVGFILKIFKILCIVMVIDRE